MDESTVFTGLHFWVDDLKATLAFYRLIGLPVPHDAEGEFAKVPLSNGVSLAFGTHSLTKRYDTGFEPPTAAKGAVALQFDLESRVAVNAMHATLTAAGHRSHLAPIDAFWGSRYAEVHDPDGNVVGFHSPSDPARRSAP